MCFCLVLGPASILYEPQRITTLYSFTAAKEGVSRAFSRLPVKGHVHSQEKKRKEEKSGETFVLSDTGFRHRLWLPMQFVQARICHYDDLKCAQPCPPPVMVNDFDSSNWSCNWVPFGPSISFLFPSNSHVQFKNMAAYRIHRHGCTAKKISTGEAGALLAQAPCP